MYSCSCHLGPNVWAEWIGTRGAARAYAGGVPRVTITLKPFVRRILLSSSCPIPSYDPAPNPAGVPPGRPATTRFRTDHRRTTRRPAGVPLRQAGPSHCALVPKADSRGRSALGRPRSTRRTTLPDPHLLCRRTSRFSGFRAPARLLPRKRRAAGEEYAGTVTFGSLDSTSTLKCRMFAI